MGKSDKRRKRLYDNACKKVLSEKGIIGHILKTCVKEFEHVTKSHYEKIKKVYSIWVCTNSSKEWEYNIARYGIIEENIIGNAKAKTAHYDLLSVVMICLGEKQYTELEGLLKLLNLVLVDNDLSPQEKKNKLTEEFSIKMTPRLERGVTKMCNLSEGVERRGIKKGMALGLAEGREQMATDMAMDMLQDDEPIEKILKYSRLPLKRIQELAEQIRK